MVDGFRLRVCAFERAGDERSGGDGVDSKLESGLENGLDGARVDDRELAVMGSTVGSDRLEAASRLFKPSRYW